MTTTIGKTFRFEAAHQLPNHAGKCAQLHGHSYRVDVQVSGEVRPADGSSGEGMVLDFAALKDAWKPIEARVDHRCLNDVLPEMPTTAENIAGWMLAQLRVTVPGVCAVRVWETESCWAEARA